MIGGTPEMTLVYCNAAYVSDSPHAPKLVNQYRPPAMGRDAWKLLLAYPVVSTPTVLANREAVLQAGLFDSSLPIAEDQDLWIKLARLGPIGYIQEVLACVHDTPGSLTKARTGEGVKCAMAVIDRHVKAAGESLTAAEIREIYAERFASLGRNAFEARETMLGLRLLLRSIRFGRPLLPIPAYIVATSPFGRLVKRLVSRWDSDVC
jgi:hypothetical protein